ncbi:MAG: 50S ribosomal protein L10 [Patescibacteria group bacterium]
MAITRKQKEEILEKTTAVLKDTPSVAFVGFKGLTVKEATELRAALKKDGVRYAVVKKTLLRKALEPKGVTGDLPELPGEVAVAYLENGEDATTTMRSLQLFVGKFKEKLAFLGGVLEGKYLSKGETVALAAIPPREILLGMFANVINSPIQRFAIALGEVSKKK